MEQKARFVNEIIDQRAGSRWNDKIVLKIEGDNWKQSGSKTWFVVLRFYNGSSIPESRNVYFSETEARKAFDEPLVSNL